jgi:pyridoxal/pyridoxine/pyridoxamine kinase
MGEKFLKRFEQKFNVATAVVFKSLITGIDAAGSRRGVTHVFTGYLAGNRFAVTEIMMPYHALFRLYGVYQV